MSHQWNHKIFKTSKADFEALALEIFRFQYEHNPVYQSFVDLVLPQITAVDSLTKIPFLPISFFKSSLVQTTSFTPEKIFESSGTTATGNSRHGIKEISLYEESLIKGFEHFYGNSEAYCFLGLLPSYLERDNSSLVYMVQKLIEQSQCEESGFYLNDYDALAATLASVESKKQKTILIGVTFALLDFAKQCPMPLQHTTIIETGGMKGRRKELIRKEVHDILQKAFGLTEIHSEYSMTELLSQAYSLEQNIFQTPPWMKVLIRSEDDPFFVKEEGAGLLNIIDLANIYSCSFIATDDAGKIYKNKNDDVKEVFEVLGRMDGSDLRGCSLLTI